MRVVFMGSAEFAVPSLERLEASRHELRAVYTQPPRPRGRGHRDQQTPVHLAAEGLGLTVATPATLKDREVQAVLGELRADIGIVVAYGLILPQAVLDIPSAGCLNVHGSLLPRLRGAAPVERAIEAGDADTGFEVFQMEAGLDTGPVFASSKVRIEPGTTAPGLRALLATKGADLLLPLLDDLEHGRARARPQASDGMTYAKKLAKGEFALDFTAPADVLERRVRAFHPNAWLLLDGHRVRVLEAEVRPGRGAPGVTIDDGLTVACGVAALRPLVVQPGGKRPMPTVEFLRGRAVPAGTRLG